MEFSLSHLLLLLALLASVHGEIQEFVEDQNITTTYAGDGKLRGEDLFANVVIYYLTGPGYLEVRNSWLGWGKWVPSISDRSTEISSPDGMQLTAWGETHVTATGRQSSPSGCQGTFDLYFNGNSRVVYVYFTTTFMGTPDSRIEVFDSNFRVKAVVVGMSSIHITLYIEYIGRTHVA